MWSLLSQFQAYGNALLTSYKQYPLFPNVMANFYLYFKLLSPSKLSLVPVCICSIEVLQSIT